MEKRGEKLTAGRTQTKVNQPEEGKCSGAARALFLIGTAFVCASLLLPMGRDGMTEEPPAPPPNAVAVMSGAVGTESSSESGREQLAKPKEKKTSAEEWSLFDSIGELFAELIFGERT